MALILRANQSQMFCSHIRKLPQGHITLLRVHGQEGWMLVNKDTLGERVGRGEVGAGSSDTSALKN